MAGAEDGCGFLTEEGKMTGFIHFVRGICGLFPGLEDIMRKMVSAIFFRYMNVRKENRAKVKVKMKRYTGSEKYENVYCQMAWITDSVTEYIAAHHPESAEGGQHGCTEEILPYSVSDGRILQ